jgi:hypothetical protein
MTPVSGPSATQADLLRIQRELASTNPELYRQLALYLQVLRQVLPQSVDQACFHLATQVQPDRYTTLSEAQRRRLHANVTALVTRSTTLLTVEQLACLAGRIAREQALRVDRMHRDSDAARDRHQPSMADGPSADPRSDLASPHAPQGGASIRLPHDGSVHLGMDLPIEGGWLGWGEAPRIEANDSAAESPAAEFTAPEFSASESSGLEPEDSDALPTEQADPDEDDTASDLFSLFSALAAAAGMDRGIRGLEHPYEQGMAEFSARDEGGGDDVSDQPSAEGEEPGPFGEWPEDAAFPFRFRALSLEFDALERFLPGRFREEDPGALYRPPEGGGLLPRDPVALLAWLEGVELALTRQLRDLSHALNTELLQCGLIRILLPLNLLEGVLKGQIEVQSSHPNLLQLPLPLPSGRSGRILRAQSILLRRADLELEQPRLRTVRGRLQQLRQEGRRMAQQYRRLQRRIQAHEAEALWLQDIRSMRPAPEHPC